MNDPTTRPKHGTPDLNAPNDVQAVKSILGVLARCAVTLDPPLFRLGTPEIVGVCRILADAEGVFALYMRAGDEQNERQCWYVTSGRIERYEPEASGG